MKIGILKKLQIGMMLFGIAMGCIFPVYAIFFVEFKPGMQIWFTLGCIVAGIVVGAFSYLLVKLILIKQLSQVATACNQISAGRIDVSLNIKSPDTIGEIASGFNMMLFTLRDLINQLTEGTKKLTLISSTLSTVNEKLLHTVDEQGSNVADVSSATHQASSTIASISNKLSATDSSAKNISEKAGEAVSLLKKSLGTMEETTHSMSSTITHMEELQKRSTDISAIVAIISDIAKQTNMLALNASVEAARAGKEGKGFAVVAEEVGKLAQRTAKATKDVGILIDAFQKGMNESIGVVKHHSDLTGSLQTMLTRSSDGVSGIIDDIDKVSETIHQISTAATEQSNTFNNINSSMQSIHSGFNDILQSTDKVITGSNTIKEFSRHLMETLRKFHRRDNASSL
jgi:methyl-accepting chemotaxis protein